MVSVVEFQCILEFVIDWLRDSLIDLTENQLHVIAFCCKAKSTWSLHMLLFTYNVYPRWSCCMSTVEQFCKDWIEPIINDFKLPVGVGKFLFHPEILYFHVMSGNRLSSFSSCRAGKTRTRLWRIECTVRRLVHSLPLSLPSLFLPSSFSRVYWDCEIWHRSASTCFLKYSLTGTSDRRIWPLCPHHHGNTSHTP